ncbi:hypothetical protein Pmar_PMAR006579 [Perkinsus marinus ATCC 50983]|uniref:Uncharacterized protein n=1 Tax=Perkinsus marinus (strain ATCC 50983 / TXsc) TaxID=423536 RepID=C5LTU2_PERM5|nr:hypothetical protein Pmar_PMAR006579 [Perkinsus marinus ATCC 50983]EEQ99904.1 hypothetical protein Pmar_PMAR006579 [Perkinsus marinus ATCC 50983]|eukprot:XP_002767187.1 hypothetical protein Pmar_PMAR006579 [Perkinsus marinus ATCC 50983]
MRSLQKKAHALKQRRSYGYNGDGHYVGHSPQGQVFYADNNKNSRHVPLLPQTTSEPSNQPQSGQQQTFPRSDDRTKAPVKTAQDQHGQEQKKKPICLRCYDRTGSHKEDTCTATKPKNQESRCFCGSGRHKKEQCPVPSKKIICTRCNNDTRAGPPHRSGMCPLTLELLQETNNCGSIPTGNGPTPPTGPSTFATLPQPQQVISTTFGTEGCFAIGDYHDKGADQFMENGSQPVATKVCVSPHLLADAILDSGAGRCYGQERYLRWLATQKGVEISWNEGAGVNAVGPVGNSLNVSGTCNLAIWPQQQQRREFSKYKVKIKVYVVENLIPQLIIGVSGLRLLRVGLIFGPDGIQGYSALAAPDREETEDGHVVNKYVAEVGDAEATDVCSHHPHNGVNSHSNDDPTCLFDSVNFIEIKESPTDDYTQDSLIPAQVSVQVHPSLSFRSITKTLTKGEGLSLEEALEHPLGTFRGLMVESENSDENNITYRALHDFNWTTRPAPSENNKAAAERHARKLFASLTKKKTQEAYTDVIHQYHKLGHIEKILPAEEMQPAPEATTPTRYDYVAQSINDSSLPMGSMERLEERLPLRQNSKGYKESSWFHDL